ncbi:MAG TPA: 1,4-alpha-glucan branching protein domain-containing protein [Chthoniobacterales bacterium]|jgi:1,4-alpha-glucan branching enzyme
MPTDRKGHLALILHAHLPFVRHPEHADFLEEDWLYEAITETYLPLLKMFHGLEADGIRFRMTLSLTPTLCAMLRDPLLQRRYLRHMDRLIGLARQEVHRTIAEPLMQEQAKRYHAHFVECRELYEKWERDLVGQFAALQERGSLEIITCAATHGFLPLMHSYPEAVRAQILIARDSYRECFGRDPRGIWLPECGYIQGIEEVLQEANIRWFVIDSHGLMFGQPRPRYAIYAPCYTPSGPAVLARDRDSSRQVWSAEEGYPGDPAYRDFYRDIGHDLSLDYLRPYLPADGARKSTGIKYHRITGRTPHKDLYHRDWAMAAADAHAGDFLNHRVAQFQKLLEGTNIEPIVVAPFDAELFGHWWHEGPEFLNLFLRKAACDQQVFELTTPSRYLEGHPTQQMIMPSASSWGHKGYWEVWLDESNAWIYPHLHVAATRMIEVATAEPGETDALRHRVLSQMARELLLAQSSDWAFLMKTGTAKEYGTKRTKDHVLRFTRLYKQLLAGKIEEPFLQFCEERDNLFPQIDWRHYVRRAEAVAPAAGA